MSIRKKMSVASVILAAAIGYLAFAGRETAYYMAVDKFVQDTQFQSKRVRLNGKVLEQGLEVNGGAMQAKFTLAGTTEKVPVSYHGVIPDMFKANHDVIVEGKLDQAGVFQADVMMTKCASKYEEKPQSHPNVQDKSTATVDTVEQPS